MGGAGRQALGSDWVFSQYASSRLACEVIGGGLRLACLHHFRPRDGELPERVTLPWVAAPPLSGHGLGGGGPPLGVSEICSP